MQYLSIVKIQKKLVNTVNATVRVKNNIMHASYVNLVYMYTYNIYNNIIGSNLVSNTLSKLLDV